MRKATAAKRIPEETASQQQERLPKNLNSDRLNFQCKSAFPICKENQNSLQNKKTEIKLKNFAQKKIIKIIDIRTYYYL